MVADGKKKSSRDDGLEILMGLHHVWNQGTRGNDLEQ